MRFRAQAAFEYMILLAGVLLIAVIGLVVFRSFIFAPASQSVEATNCWARLAKDSNCYIGAQWNACGQVDRFKYVLPDGSFCASLQTPQGCVGNLPANKLWCGEVGIQIQVQGSPSPSVLPSASPSVSPSASASPSASPSPSSSPSPSPSPSPGGTYYASITVQPSVEQGDFPKAVFGHQNNFITTKSFNDNYDKSNSSSTVFKQSVINALQPLKIPSFRFSSGLFSDLYKWDEAIGPLSTRSSWNYFWPNGMKFGTDEILKGYSEINPQAQVIVTLNARLQPTDYAVRMAGDWIEYLNGIVPGKTTGWTVNDWLTIAGNSSCYPLNQTPSAKVCYRPGVMPQGYYAWLRSQPEYGNRFAPYGITYFEVGNEVNDAYGGYPAYSPAQYASVLNSFGALKQNYSNIKLGGVLALGYSQWNDAVVQQAKACVQSGTPCVDFLIPHYYGGGGNLDYVNMGWNMNVSSPVFPVSQAQQLRIRAHGSDCGNPSQQQDWPHMVVKMDGQQVYETYVQTPNYDFWNSSSWYYYPRQGEQPISVPQGNHSVELIFDNDCYMPQTGANRNLYVERVQLMPSGSVVELISPQDFAKEASAQAKAFGDDLIAIDAVEQQPPSINLPYFLTEFNTAFVLQDPFRGQRVLPYDELDKTMLSSFFVVPALSYLLDHNAGGAYYYLMQELVFTLRLSLLAFTGDVPGSDQNAVGNAYGNANYMFYSTMADDESWKKISYSVDTPKYASIFYLTPTETDVPLVRAWAVKTQSGKIRITVSYVGEKPLDLNLNIANYAISGTVDITQLHNDALTAFNSHDGSGNIDWKIVPQISQQPGITNNHTFSVPPFSIVTFTYYPQ
ncbi:MAG: carbohydrate-binding domain-containing protein [Candidatus Norongarragalinales archaeon]